MSTLSYKTIMFICLLSLFVTCADPGMATENVLFFDDYGNVISSCQTGLFSDAVLSQTSDTIEIRSLTFPNGATGTPAISTFSATVPGGATIFVPNRLSGTYPATPADLPDISLYSFEDAMTNPAGDIPGLSYSPSQGTYDSTIMVTVNAIPGAVVEYKENGQWKPANPENSLSLPIYKTTSLVLRARSGAVTGSEITALFTINYPQDVNPEMVDTDGDGVPDSWEVEHGMNPLAADLDADTNGNTISDFMELLRGAGNVDDDGDGWPTFDENLRQTNAYDVTDFPTARSLYEVEYRMDIDFSTVDNSPIPVRFKVSEIDGTVTYKMDMPDPYTPPVPVTTATGIRLPAGASSIVRAEGGSDGKYVLKQYLPMIPDVKVSDLKDWCELPGNPDYSWNNAQEWENLFILMLTDLLAPREITVHCTPQDTVPVFFLERQLALGSGIDADVDLFFGLDGYAPSPETIRSMERILMHRKIAQGEMVTATGFNYMVDDITGLLGLDSSEGCGSLVERTVQIYTDYSDDGSSMEKAAAAIMAEPLSQSMASLLLAYSLEELDTIRQQHALSWCQLFAPDGDVDGDQVENLEELLNHSNIDSADSDGDTIVDSIDNCPTVANPLQLNYDGDLLGDACDPDDDNDGLTDLLESAFGSNPFNPDTDNDETGDLQEWEQYGDPGIAVYIVPHSSVTTADAFLIEGYRSAGALVSLQSDINSDLVAAITYPTETSWQVLVSNLRTQTGIHRLRVDGLRGSSTGEGYGDLLTSLLKGDLNDDGRVDLNDTILSLQILVGMQPGGLYSGSDVNGDGKISIEELVYTLEKTAKQR